MDTVISYTTVMSNSNNRNDVRYLPFGEALRYYREQAGIKQETLADMVGIEQSTLSRWENQMSAPNKPFVLHQIADILRVDPDDLRAGRVRSEVPAVDGDEDMQAFTAFAHKHAPNLPVEDAIEGLQALNEMDPRLRRLWITFFRGVVSEIDDAGTGRSNNGGARKMDKLDAG